MPSPSDIRAGRAFVELGANDASLQKALNKAAAGLKRFGNHVRAVGAGLSAVGASVVTPLAAAAVEFGKMGSEMAKSSAITGIAVEEMSTLAYAAQQTGTELEAVQSGIGKMNKLLLAAAKGNQQANTTLAELNLSFARLNHLSPEERFKTIADALSKVKDEGQRSAMAMQLFGRGGNELLPLLTQGRAGIEAFQKQARELGLQMSGEDAAAARQYTQTMKTMWDVLQHGTFSVGAAVAPTLIKVARAVTLAAETATKWVKEHKELIATAFLVASAVLAIGGAIVTIGTIIVGLGAALAAVATAIGVIVDLVGAVVAAVTSPLGLIVLALGAATYAFLRFSNAGKSAVSAVLGVLSELKDHVLSVFGGIKDAIAAGDFQLAFAIIKAEVALLWANIKVLWANGIARITAPFAAQVNVMRNAWTMFTGWISSAWSSATSYIAATWGRVTAFVVAAWGNATDPITGTMNVLRATWAAFTQFVSNAWSKTIGYLTTAWNAVSSKFHAEIDALSTAWGSFTQYLKDAFGEVYTAISAVWSAVTGYIVSAWGRTSTWFSASSGTMWDRFKSALSTALDRAVFVFSIFEAEATHLKLTMALMWNTIELGAVRAFERIKYMMIEVIPTALGWLAANGPKLMIGLYIKLWDMQMNFFRKTWDYVKDFGPKIAKMLWAAIKGGVKMEVAFDNARADAFKRGFNQDVQDTKAPPKFREREESETEKRLEKEHAGLASDLGAEINKAYAKNIAALERLKEKLTATSEGKPPAPSAGPTPEQELATAQKDLANLLHKANKEAADAKPPEPPKLPPDIERGFEGLESKGKTAGTFSAAAARELGGGGSGKQIAHNTKRMADLLDQVRQSNQKIADKLFQGAGLSFG